jgi:hypothetical protein
VIIFHNPVRAFEGDDYSLFELPGGDHDELSGSPLRSR